MLNVLKRLTAIVLAFAMVLSLGVSAYAAESDKVTEETIEGELTLYATNVTVNKSSEQQTENILFYMDKNAGICSIGVDIELEGSTQNVIADKIALGNVTSDSLDLQNSKTNASGAGSKDVYVTYNSDIDGYLLFSVPVVIEPNVVGTYTVNFNVEDLCDADTGDGYDLASNTVTATITVEEPAAPQADYEIYYTLSGSTENPDPVDSDADNYMEHDVSVSGDEWVYAYIYLRNNTDETVTLQAYDIYLEYHQDLVYWDESLSGTAYKTAGSDGEVEAKSKDLVTHIQLVADDENYYLFEPDDYAQLGAVIFKIGSGAKYGEQLNINLITGKDFEDVTNISLATGMESTETEDYDTEGQSQAYYPADTTEVNGVEVMTTYTVTYNANGGQFEDGAVTSQVKKHNIDLTLVPGTPSREGWNFLGWSTDEGENNSVNVGATYTDNADETFYAVWKRNTKVITFNANDGSETPATKTQTVNYNEATALDSNTFERIGYTFAGWNTVKVPTTENPGKSYQNDAQITITEDTTLYAQWTINKYTVTWYNGNTVLEKDEGKDAVEHNGAPSYDSNEPVMTGSEQYSYEFKGWTTTENPEYNADVIENLDAYKVTSDTNFYAVFIQKTNQYEVTYTDEGTTTTSGKVDYNGTTKLPEAKGKTGYTFTGWYSGENRVGGAGDDYTVTKDITLTAVYKANEYTVQFNANGGSGDAMADMSFTYDQAKNLTKNTYKKDNANFAGWNTKEDGTGDHYSDEQSVSNLTTEAKGTVTLYAQWTNLYTVTLGGYTADEGEVTATPAIGAEGTEITLSAVAKEGYEFVGYTAVAESGDSVTVTNGKFEMPASNVTVTATFQKSDLTVKVDSVTNGSVNIEAGETDVTEKTDAKVGDTITLNVVPNEGYKVTSVTYVKSGDNTAVAQNATPGENNTYTFTMPAYGVTVEAKFEIITYTITFDGNGANTGEMAAMTGVKYDSDEDVKLSKNTFTKNGYTFAGWLYNGNTYADGASAEKLTTVDGATVTMVAQWNNATYEIKLNTDNGTYTEGYSAPVSYIFGTGATLPTADNISKTGYDFEGWYDNADLTGNPVTEIGTDAYGDKEYWAKWTEATYSVTLNTDGGTIAEGKNVTEYTYGTGATLPTADDITKPGYTFDGWYTNKDCTGDKVTEITGTDVGAKEYWAKWTATPYTITLNLDGGTFDAAGWTLAEGKYTKTYTINDTVTLPTPSKVNYTFVTWEIVKNEGNWNGSVNAGEYSEYYGNVELKAKWDIGFTYSVESYTYAKTGYKMLRIATDGNTNAYKFGDETMYYTDNGDYQITITNADQTTTKKNVFVTLIPIMDGEIELVTSENKLTEAAMAKIAQTTDSATVIARDGDINGDTVVNIADANVVYQMVQNGGSYYGDLAKGEQSDILSRLEADMSTETNGEDNRGTTEDVDVIVTKINTNN